MAKNATLTFGMDLSDFDKAMKSINKQATSLSDQINKVTQGAMQAYKNGLSDLKANPFQSAKFHTDLANLKENIKKATTARLNLKIDEAKKQIAGIKQEIVTVLGSALILSKPIKSAMDFEKAMVDVKKVTNFSASGFKKFSGDLIKLTREVPKNMNELAGISFEGAKLGIAQDQLLDYTKLVAQMANAYEMSTADAGSSIANLKSVFKLESIKDVERMGDYINYVADTSNTSVPKIISVLNDVGAAGELINLNSKNLINLAGAMTSLSIPANEASTTMSKVFSVLSGAKKPTASAKWAFNELGIDVKDMHRAFEKDGEGTLLRFLDMLKGLSRFRKAEIIKALFGQEHINNVSTLVKGLDDYKENIKKAADEKAYIGGVQREDAKQKETLAYQMAILKNGFEEVSQKIGELFLPILKTSVSAITSAINGVSSFVSMFPNFIKYTFAAAAALTAIKTAILVKNIAVSGATLMLGNYQKMLQKLPFNCLQLGASLKECGIAARFKAAGMNAAAAASKTWSAHAVAAGAGSLSFTAGIKNAIVAVRALGAAAMANPIGLIIAVIAAVGFTIYKYWDRVKAFFSGFWEGLKEGLGPLFESLSEYWEIIKTVFSPLKSLFGWLIDCFSSFFSQSEATKESLAGFADAGRTVGKVFAAVIDFVTKPLQWIIGMIKDIFNFMVDSKLGKWISGKTVLSVGEKNVSGAIGEQTTAGSVDQVAQDRREMRSQTSQNQITDNKKIDINLYGSQATPQAVAQAVSDNGYGFGD